MPLEDMMRNRPPVDHDDAHQDLPVARFPVPTVPVLGQARGPRPFKVGRRQIVEDQIHVQRKQIPEAQEQVLLDLRLPRD